MKKSYEFFGYFWDGTYMIFNKNYSEHEFYEAILMQSTNSDENEIQWNIDEYAWNCSVEDLQSVVVPIDIKGKELDEFVKNIYIKGFDKLEKQKDLLEVYNVTELQYKEPPKRHEDFGNIGYKIVNYGIEDNNIIKYKCSQCLKDYNVVNENCNYIYELCLGDSCLIILEINE